MDVRICAPRRAPGRTLVTPAQCGVNVALLVDLSTSVRQTSGAQTQVRNAAAGVVDALTGTPSQVAIHTFGTKSPAPETANTNLGLTSVATSADAAPVRAKAQSLSTGPGDDGTWYTNWDDGLWKLQPMSSQLDAVIMITDGMPTRYGPNGDGSSTRFIEMENAIASANALKAPGKGRSGDGVSVIAVGAGAGISGDSYNLQAI